MSGNKNKKKKKNGKGQGKKSKGFAEINIMVIFSNTIQKPFSLVLLNLKTVIDIYGVRMKPQTDT